MTYALPAMIVTTGLLLATSSGAAPREPYVAAGETGRLTVEVVQSGATVRSLKLEMNLVSQETTFVNLLGDGSPEGVSERFDHEAAKVADGLAEMDELSRLVQKLSDACQKDEQSPDCLAAGLEVQSFEDRRAQRETEAEAAPLADADKNRFQAWAGDAQGCGVLTSTVGTKTRRLVADSNTTADKEEFDVCYSTMTIDRRNGELYLRLMPISISMPGEELGTFDFLRFIASPGVQPDRGFIGSLPSVIFQRVPTTGSPRAFTAETLITAEGSPPAVVQIRFEVR